MTSGNGSSSFDVVGGSQAGFATGYHLARRGLSLCDDDAAFIAGRIDPHLENRTGRVGMDSERT
jgi:hypothetical protein